MSDPKLPSCPYCNAPMTWCECDACDRPACKRCGYSMEFQHVGGGTLEESRSEVAAHLRRVAQPNKEQP